MLAVKVGVWGQIYVLYMEYSLRSHLKSVPFIVSWVYLSHYGSMMGLKLLVDHPLCVLYRNRVAMLS